MHTIAAGVAGCLLEALTAQTYVVDAAGGPGSHFTSIAAATPAVPEGATLIVRAGIYEPFSSGRGITILGEPGARIDGSNGIFGIGGVQAGRRFAMRGIELASTGGMLFWLSASAGAVLLDFPPGPPVVGDFRISGCADVQVRGLAVHNPQFGPLDVGFSNVSLVGCDLRCAGPDNAILQKAGVLQLANCHVEAQGGGIFPSWNSANLVGVTVAGRIEVRASTIVGPAGGAAYAYAISGEGTAFVDNATVFQNVFQLSAPAAGGAQLLAATFADLATCTATAAPLGGVASASVQGPAGSIAVLFAGFPAPPATVPGVQYPLWVGAGTTVTMAVGAGSAAGSYNVPNAAWVLGVGIGWQGLTWDAANGLQFSNADTCVQGP